jgi:hypothetical protein
MLKVKSPLICHVGTQIPWCPRWNGKLHILVFSNFNVTGQALRNNKQFTILHKITEFYSECFSVSLNIISNVAPSPYLKVSSENFVAQIKLVRMSVIFYCTKLHSTTKCNSSWVVSIEINVNFNFLPPTIFILSLLECDADHSPPSSAEVVNE